MYNLDALLHLYYTTNPKYRVHSIRLVLLIRTPIMITTARLLKRGAPLVLWNRRHLPPPRIYSQIVSDISSHTYLQLYIFTTFVLCNYR